MQDSSIPAPEKDEAGLCELKQSQIIIPQLHPADTVPEKPAAKKEKDKEKSHKALAIASLSSSLGGMIALGLFILVAVSVAASTDAFAAIFGVLLMAIFGAAGCLALLLGLILALAAIGIKNKNEDKKVTKLAVAALLLAIAGIVTTVLLMPHYF